MPSHTYRYTDIYQIHIGLVFICIRQPWILENIYSFIYHLKSCVWTTKNKKKTKEPGITFHTV